MVNNLSAKARDTETQVQSLDKESPVGRGVWWATVCEVAKS